MTIYPELTLDERRCLLQMIEQAGKGPEPVKAVNDLFVDLEVMVHIDDIIRALRDLAGWTQTQINELIQMCENVCYHQVYESIGGPPDLGSRN